MAIELSQENMAKIQKLMSPDIFDKLSDDNKDKLKKIAEMTGVSMDNVQYEQVDSETVDQPPLMTKEDMMATAIAGPGGTVKPSAERNAMVEDRIAGRELVNIEPQAGLRGSIAGPTGISDVLSQGIQRGEAAVGNAALAMQGGRNVLGDVIAGLRGQRLGKLADVFEKSGTPKPQAEIAQIVVESQAGEAIKKAASIGTSITKKAANKVVDLVSTPPKKIVLQQKASELKSAYSELQKGSSAKFKSYTKRFNKYMEENVTKMEESLANAAQTGAGEFREKLPKIFKQASESYGQVIDDLNAEFLNSGGNIKDTELVGILKKTFDESDVLQLTDSGPVRAKLNSMLKKYGKKIEANVSPILDASGKPIRTAVDIKAKSIDLRDALNDVKEINKSMRKAFSSGFSDEDVVGSIFHKNWVDYLDEKGIPVKELNSRYKTVIQAKKAANRVFKPYKGSFESKTAENFLKRAGKGKLSGGETELVKFLEGGSEFNQGVGNITEDVSRIGKSIAEAKSRAKDLRNMILNASGREKSRLEKELGSKLGEITKQQVAMASRSENAKAARDIALLVSGGGAAIYAVGRLASHFGD